MLNVERFSVAYSQGRWGVCNRIDPCAQPLTEGVTPGSPALVLCDQRNIGVKIVHILQLCSRWETQMGPVLQLRVYYWPRSREGREVNIPDASSLL